MVNIRNSIEANRRLMYAILILLVFMGVVGAKFYLDQRKENRALRLKILSMSTTKRNPKPWSQVLSNPKAVEATPKTPVSQTQAPTAEAVTSNEKLPPIVEQETHQIASSLDASMRNIQKLEPQALDQNIALADELISREPDSYAAYKAKLISMLMKEGKFKESIDEGELEGVLESMAQFNLGNDALARREAAIIASGNADIENAEGNLEEIRSQRETLEAQIEGFEPNSPEAQSINENLNALHNQENTILERIAGIEENVGLRTNQMISEETVEIPFMRMLAQGNYTGVGENAESFINEFPNSPQGYYYLVRSMELQGQRDNALNVIRSAPLTPEDRQRLVERLDKESSQDPKEYWKNLNF